MNLFSFYSIQSVLGKGNYQLSIIESPTLLLLKKTFSANPN